MRPTDVIRFLHGMMDAVADGQDAAVYLEGPPGIGKTELPEQVAKERKVCFVKFHPVFSDPVDLRGIPKVTKDNFTIWCPPDLLKADQDSTGIFLIDELPQAERAVMNACGPLLLDKTLADRPLPKKWLMVATGNRQQDRAGANRLFSQIADRVIRIRMEVSNEDWQIWALQHGVQAEVRAFLNFCPKHLFDFDTTRDDQNATPRSWTRLSRILPYTPADLLHPVSAGCVGEGRAVEFVAFTRTYRDLPDVNKVLANPHQSAIPKQLDRLYALSGAIVEKVRKCNNELLNNAAIYTMRMPKEFAMLTMLDIQTVNNSLKTLPVAQEWFYKNREFLIDNTGGK